METPQPYTDCLTICEDLFYRIFDPNHEDMEYVWHRDSRDRMCIVIEGSGWQFQKDEDLPFELHEGDVVSITKLNYHRLIRGDNRLVMKIMEL